MKFSFPGHRPHWLKPAVDRTATHSTTASAQDGSVASPQAGHFGLFKRRVQKPSSSALELSLREKLAQQPNGTLDSEPQADKDKPLGRSSPAAPGKASIDRETQAYIDKQLGLSSPTEQDVRPQNVAEYLSHWDAWQQKGGAEGEDRATAVRRMRQWLTRNRPQNTLDLRGLGLTSLPDHLPATLMSLDLSHNRFIRLPKENPAAIRHLVVDANYPRPNWVGWVRKLVVRPKPSAPQPPQPPQPPKAPEPELKSPPPKLTPAKRKQGSESVQAQDPEAPAQAQMQESPPSTPAKRKRESAVLRQPDPADDPSTEPLAPPRMLPRQFSDVQINRAKPPHGNASDFNDVDPTVPGFPQLHRGSALANGDCLFNSLIHIAKPLLAQQTGTPPENLTATTLRQHVASHLIQEFQIHGLSGNQNTAPMAGESSYALLSEVEVNPPPPHSRSDLARLLGSELRVAELEVLTPTQQAHVIQVATPLQFGGITADLMPSLLADAFPGLQLITHRHDSSAESLAEYGTFFKNPETGHDGKPLQTVRVYLDNEHYEPVLPAPEINAVRPANTDT